MEVKEQLLRWFCSPEIEGAVFFSCGVWGGRRGGGGEERAADRRELGINELYHIHVAVGDGHQLESLWASIRITGGYQLESSWASIRNTHCKYARI